MSTLTFRHIGELIEFLKSMPTDSTIVESSNYINTTGVKYNCIGNTYPDPNPPIVFENDSLMIPDGILITKEDYNKMKEKSKNSRFYTIFLLIKLP